MGCVSIEAAAQSGWNIIEWTGKLTNEFIEYSEAFRTVELGTPSRSDPQSDCTGHIPGHLN